MTLSIQDRPADYPVLINGGRHDWSEEALTREYGASAAAAMVFEALQYSTLQGIKAEYGNLLLQLLQNPSVEERDTWKSQQAWAEKYLADSDAASAALLAMLLTADERAEQGVNAAAFMANIIMQKVTYTNTLIALAGGIRRTAEKAVEAATTAAEIKNAARAARAAAAAAIAAL